MPADIPELAFWREEVAALDAVLGGLAGEDWLCITQFMGWRVADHVQHLALADGLAALSAGDPEGFCAYRAGDRESGVPAEVPAANLLSHWRDGNARLDAALEALRPDVRLPWYGPDMSIRAFVVARQMECWAHGQTIHDALGRGRAATDRLRPICELGWRTQGWSFQNRGLSLPAAPIRLELTAPSGAVWRWGAPEATESIAGLAEDFALVVCQCRNIADTTLTVSGDGAVAWMEIAQCFAGPPVDPPAAGRRFRHREVSLP